MFWYHVLFKPHDFYTRETGLSTLLSRKPFLKPPWYRNLNLKKWLLSAILKVIGTFSKALIFRMILYLYKDGHWHSCLLSSGPEACTLYSVGENVPDVKHVWGNSKLLIFFPRGRNSPDANLHLMKIFLLPLAPTQHVKKFNLPWLQKSWTQLCSCLRNGHSTTQIHFLTN